MAFKAKLIRLALVALASVLCFIALLLFCSSKLLGELSILRAITSLDRKLIDTCRKPADMIQYSADEEQVARKARELLKRNICMQSLNASELGNLIQSADDSVRQIQRTLRTDRSQNQAPANAITKYLDSSRQLLETRTFRFSGLSDLSLWLALITVLLALFFLIELVNLIRHRDLPGFDNAPQPTVPLDGLDQLALSMSGFVTLGTKSAKNYLDNMPVGLITTDEAGAVCSINLAAIKLLKSPADQITGKNIGNLFQAEGRTHVLDLESLQEIALNRIVELKLIPLPSGAASVPVDVSLVEFSGPTGTGFIANVLDVSDRYEVERLKTDFLSMVSHDLRTPLTSIGIFVSSITKSIDSLSLSANQKTMAISADTEIHRLMRLVNSLLEIAKIRSGKLELHKTSVYLEPLLARLHRSMSVIAQKKSVSLSIDVIPDFIVADEDRIYQTLENLTANAIKFSPDKGAVRVVARAIPSGIIFEIRDQGPGVPADKRNLIFERFEQVSNEDSTIRGGAGLGLAISKLIVEQHGGSIGIDSELGKGSCFWFILPD